MGTTETPPVAAWAHNGFGERYLPEINPHAFTSTDSTTIFRQRFSELLTKENSLHVIIGTDSGLLPLFILKNGPAEGSRYLFIETDEIYPAIHALDGLKNLSPNLVITSARHWFKEAQELQLVDYIYLDAVRIWDSLSVNEALFPGYPQLAAEVRKQLDATAYEAIMKLGSKNYINKQIANLSENKTPGGILGDFKERFRSKTALVLGGGPSLDEFLPWIKQHQHDVAIFAVSRVSKSLFEQGIVPHFIVSIDHQDCNFGNSREMFLFPDGPLLINANHVAPRLLSTWSGPSIYLAERFPWHTPLNKNILTPWGPTVTNTALGVAVEMGFGQVLLVGVDLCFSQKGFTHAQDSDEYQTGPKLDSTLTVETNGGGIAETQSDYSCAIKYLSEQTELARQKNCRVISPAINAAKIENIPFKPIEQISIEPLEQSALTSIQDKLPEESRENRERENLLIREELNRISTQTEKILTLLHEAEAYLNKNKTENGQKKLKYVAEIYKKIRSGQNDANNFIKQYNLKAFTSIISSINIKNIKQKAAAEKLPLEVSTYIQSAQEVLDILAGAKDRVYARLEEDAPVPDLEKIKKAWDLDISHGARILVWKKRRPDLYSCFSKADLEIIHKWESVNNNSIRERLSEEYKIERSYPLDGVDAKAANLFADKNRTSLQRLIDGLERHPDTEAAGELLQLVRGYLYELDHQYDQALSSYQELVHDTMTPLAEEALRRISLISLSQNNLETAALALECLSHTSLVYLEKYADLLCLLDRRQEAADRYIDYLERAPQDIEALIKLGKNYRAMGAEDAARQIFELVLQQQPTNETARALLVASDKEPV
ncbi:MAG: DUF115 domain-containing protein [Desulfuromonadaceae bacterium]|nr:DUF115 domain-containing protein [Desulfuromonadaceae bacterium]